MQLRKYQIDGIDEIARLYGSGVRRIVFQMPTGSGKTVAFSGLINRFLSSFNKSVLVAVHRDELLNQTRKTLYNHFHIHSEPIVAGKKHIPSSRAYVGMVETLNNIIKKRPKWCEHIGLLIVDECHIANFNKIYEAFPNALIIGFTATPIAASKKTPLKLFFNEIVVGPQIEELIEIKSLVPNITYNIKGIDKKKFGKRGNDYDDKAMAKEYSTVRHVKNTVEAYKKYGRFEKTIIFNVNIEHSLLVNQAFIDAGYPSRHLDGDMPINLRKETFTWFKNTPGAILNNVGVATTGFDEPSIINVIVNKSTLSLPLWLQMTGRGSRPYHGKEYFRIIDMGGNAKYHGDWSIYRDWYDIFHNPDKPSTGGVAAVKDCAGCDAIIPASTIFCKFCGHEHERRIGYDTFEPEFEIIVSRFNIEDMVADQIKNNHKPWKPFFEILNKTISILKYRSYGIELTAEDKERVYLIFEARVKEWCKVAGRPFARSTQAFARQKFEDEFNKLQLVKTI